MKNRKVFKSIMAMTMVFVMMAFFGCSKNMGAESIAKQFLQDINEGKAYRMVHNYVETKETLEITRDANGNVHTVSTSEGSTKDEVYYVDGVYTVYIDGALTTDYDEAFLATFVEEALKEAPFYLENTLEVFSREIDSDIVEMKEENVFRAVGSYDDGTAYYYSYGKDGDYFDCFDAYDDIKIYLEESIVVKQPQ